MKAIAAGEDPGNIGVKDTSSLLNECSSPLNVKDLCNPNLSASNQIKTEAKPQNQSNLVSPEILSQPPPNIVSNYYTI